MPRSGWLAVGAIVASLGATAPWIGQAWLAQPAVWLLLAGSWTAVLVRWHGARRTAAAGEARPGAIRRLALPMLVGTAGALLVGLRLVAAPIDSGSGAAALPTGS